jgi:hypothetical protein
MRLAMVLTFVLLGASGAAQAQVVSQNMSCGQAVAQFQNSGMVYKSVHGQALPIRVGVPVAYRHSLRCEIDERATPYWVPTTDTRRCVISYHCTPSGRPFFDD